jgi:hypothetical protein
MTYDVRYSIIWSGGAKPHLGGIKPHLGGIKPHLGVEKLNLT